MMVEQMTAEQQSRIIELVKLISAAISYDHDAGEVINALSFCLLGRVKVAWDLGDREAVEFCAKHFKTYAQTVWS